MASFDKRWEVLRDIGSGGQGVVKLVRDKQRFDIDKVRTAFIDSLKKLTNNVTVAKDPKPEAFASFMELMPILSNASTAENLGALKVLHDPADARDPDRAKERIKRELEGMAQVSHPNLLKILDSDPDGHWYVSEFQPNGALADHPAAFEGNLLLALRTLRPLIGGVAELHSRQIVHRDIKPQNIFFSSIGELVLGDFGLVYFTDKNRTRLSATMENVGSRDWMPPWAMSVRLEDVHPTFDVFSLGKVLWCMISGKPVLPLWYCERPQYDLQAIFPTNRYMGAVNHLLRKCVVEEESDCLPNAGELLKEIDKLVNAIEVRANVVSGVSNRPCDACGHGTYSQLGDHDISNSGIGSPAGDRRRLKVFVCNNCGHVQSFLRPLEGQVPAWDDVR